MTTENVIEFREKTFFYTRGGAVLFDGTPDLVRIWPQRRIAAISDLKTGRKTVPGPALNLQLRAYVAMVWEGRENDLDAIYGAILQPRISSKPHVVMYRRSELPKVRDDLESIYDMAHSPNVPRVASENCAFCTAKAICREYATWIGAVEKAMGLPVAQWSDAQINVFLSRRRELLNFLEDAYEQLKQLKRVAPERMPEWQFKPGNKVRVVADVVAAWEVLKDHFDGRQFSDAAKLSLTDLERILWASRYNTPNAITKKAATELINQWLGDIIVKVENEPSLARKKDEE